MCGVAPAALLLVASMSMAQAADPVAVAVPAPAATPFTGFYIGGHAGYGSADYEGSWDDDGTPAVSFDNRGKLFGMQAGYNWEVMQNVLLGVEGDITVAPWNASYSENGDTAVFGHLSGIASLRARLGYVLDETLIYATGGVAFASSNAGGGDTIQHNRRAELITGAVAGAGVEWLLSPSVALRAEGLYYWFDQKDSAPGESGFGGIQDTWVARVGASWYFNGSKPVDDMYGAMAGDAFSGFYVGGHSGYGSADYRGSDDSDGTEYTVKNEGYLVGVQAGYNWKTASNLVLGIEGDITVAPWNISESENPGSDAFIAGHLSGIASLRARLGYQIDRTLIYATGGIAFAGSNGSGGGTLEYNKKAEIVTGAVAGAGFEWMVSDKVAVRAEGLYYWFDQDQSGNQTTGFSGIQDTWLARVGASYYFNAGAADNGEPFMTDFSGVYLGGFGGYGSANYDGTSEDGGGSHHDGSPDFAGYSVGGLAGYNWQIADMAIAGIEADIGLNPWGGAEATNDDSEFVAGQLSGIASLRGRLGISMDRSLIYATGGVAFASSSGSGGDTLQLNRKAEIIAGPVVGGGVEWMATENLSLRAEGLYYWFDQKQDGNGGTGYAGIQDTWQARLGASWYFR